jgi:predicted Zn-dependent protease
MSWIRSMATVGVVAMLLGPSALAAPKRPKVPPSPEEQQIKESGYSGWRLKWSNINQVGDRNLCGGLDFYSLERQMAMGKQVAQQIMRTSKLIRDPVVTEYVNRVGQNIALNSDSHVPFTFHVIDSDVVNSFALPGGFVFVNSGLILHAGDEAELASVMGHEIAHVAACHGAKQQTKSALVQLAMIPLSIALPYGWAGYGIYQGLNAAIPLAFLKFSRTDESQADYLGLEYMYKAGYDPNAFPGFFEKIEAQEKRQPGSVSRFFSDHPTTPDRIRAIQKEIATILPPRQEYVVDTSEFEQVKARLERIEDHTQLQAESSNRPTLRNKSQTKDSDPGPPVLKHRTEAPQNSQP